MTILQFPNIPVSANDSEIMEFEYICNCEGKGFLAVRDDAEDTYHLECMACGVKHHGARVWFPDER